MTTDKIESAMTPTELPPAVVEEIERAIAKFPTWPTDPLHALAVLGEEFGELTKAMLQLVYEPHKTSTEEIRKEAIQTAAMALRLLASLDVYEYKRGIQHKQSIAHFVLAQSGRDKDVVTQGYIDSVFRNGVEAGVRAGKIRALQVVDECRVLVCETEPVAVCKEAAEQLCEQIRSLPEQPVVERVMEGK